MKKVIFSIALLVCSNNLFSQSENTPAEKKTITGFQLGSSYSSIINKNAIPTNYDATTGIGYKIGLQMDRKISNSISILPKIELSLNNVVFRKATTNFNLNETSINIMLHTAKHFNNFKKKPYVYVGPNFSFPLIDKTKYNFITSKTPGFAIDFGLGLDFKKDNFIFSPEFKYSYGYVNVLNMDGYPKCNLHTFSILFNFKG